MPMQLLSPSTKRCSYRLLFGINPNGTSIINLSLCPDKMKKYTFVKSVEQYNDMINIITNWGDDAVLREASPDDPEKATIIKFHGENLQGRNYIRFFKVEEAKAIDGSQKMILKHKKSGGIVSNMLNIFDVIQEAHCRQGHLKVEKTLANCTSMFHSPAYELCRLFINDCFICHKKHPNVLARKGAKKPTLSSEFHDQFQVDLIDMRMMRK
jgi:hypothetical protein